tara:strand:- start:814 stop:1056 length:243 start_codon:yes stop_codon:yes gene_type:complete
MQYYLLLKGDSEKDSHYDSNLLGDESFGTFYSGQAFKTLTKIIETDPEALDDAKVITDMGQRYTITEFLDKIKKLKIFIN